MSVAGRRRGRPSTSSPAHQGELPVPPGASRVMRVHAACVGDDEVKAYWDAVHLVEVLVGPEYLAKRGKLG